MLPLRKALPASNPYLDSYNETIRALPDIADIRGRIARLAIAPIKSLGMLQLPTARVTMTGLTSEDGRWRNRSVMLIHRNTTERTKDQYPYLRLSQRKMPPLVLAQPSIEGNTLVYNSAGMDALEIDADELYPRDRGKVTQVKLHDGDKDTTVVSGVLESGRITQWVREFANENCFDSPFQGSLEDIEVLIPTTSMHREVSAEHSHGFGVETIYSDGGQVHVISQGTVDWMNAGLKEKNGSTFRDIPAEAFRYEILLDDLPPNAEDIIGIGQVSIARNTRSSIYIAFASLCARCTVPSVDIQTGEVPDKEPFIWLKDNRPKRDGKPTMGINAAIPSPSDDNVVISVGDGFSAMTEKDL